MRTARVEVFRVNGILGNRGGKREWNVAATQPKKTQVLAALLPHVPRSESPKSTTRLVALETGV